jgi:hypothetical protein
MDAFPWIYALPGSGSTGLCGSSSAACLGGPILTLSAAAAITITRNIDASTVTVAAVSAASVGRPHLMRSATLAAAFTFPRPRARSGLRRQIRINSQFTGVYSTQLGILVVLFIEKAE